MPAEGVSVHDPVMSQLRPRNNVSRHGHDHSLEHCGTFWVELEVEQGGETKASDFKRAANAALLEISRSLSQRLEAKMLRLILPAI